jgi:hypothetical protein
LIKWWRKIEIVWSVRGANIWKCERRRENEMQGSIGLAEEIGSGAFSTDSSYEPVLKVFSTGS